MITKTFSFHALFETAKVGVFREKDKELEIKSKGNIENMTKNSKNLLNSHIYLLHLQINT